MENLVDTNDEEVHSNDERVHSEDDTSTLIVTPHKTSIKTLVEVPLGLFFLAFSLSDTVLSNIILYRTCTISLGYNATDCSLLVSSKNESQATRDLEELVQPVAAKVIMAKSLIVTLFPAVISLILGPWSDSHGRKPLIVASTIGYLLSFVLIVVYAEVEVLSPWWIVACFVPYSLLGGTSSMLTGGFCYIFDITNEASRSYRMALIEGVVLFGVLCGNLGNPYLLRAVGYTMLFVVCSVILFLGLIYAVFIMKESLLVLPHEDDRTSFIDPSLVTSMVEACIKPRPDHRRAILFLVMSASTLDIFILQGSGSVLYLFMREKLNWTLQDFSMFEAFLTAVSIFGILVVSIVLQKYLQCRDSIISIMAYGSLVVKSMFFAFATNSRIFYISICATFLGGMSGPTNRAILSKIVPGEDVGKVLSLTTSLESISPLISVPLYSILYQNTLTSMPGLFNFVTAGVTGFNIMCLGIVDYLLRKISNNYNLLIN